MSLPNLFQSDEEKANAQKNSRMMETGDAPDCLKKCITETEGNVKSAFL